MRALRLMGWKSDPVLADVADPSPGPGQVVIRVGGAGACHSDATLALGEDEPRRVREELDSLCQSRRGQGG